MKKSASFKPARANNKTFTKKKLYDNPEWTAYSSKFLSINTRCYACGSEARVVDHVVAAKNDEIKFWDITNLIPLCISDHNTVTARYDRFPVPKTEAKMKFLYARRMETETTVRVKIVPRK